MAHEKYKAERRYVLGFAFRPDMASVLLLKKTRPDWQAGRWNGLGGHVEKAETFDAAMVREGIEECGKELVWERFAVLEGINNDGKGFRCACYRAFFPFNLKDPEQNDVGETFQWFEAEAPPFGCIANLYWLIPLARDLYSGLEIVRARYNAPALDLAAQSLR
jgi:8-oxo-dGTP pyrophosphatase MutT (NUDIX family)